jgi:glycosyltransferase involved in cell wall biosynthesis
MSNPAPGEVIIAHPMDANTPDQGGGVRYLMNLVNQFAESGSRVTILGVQRKPAACERRWRQLSLIKDERRFPGGIPFWVCYLLALYSRLPFIKISTQAVILTHRMDCMLAFVLFKPRNPKVLISAAPAYYLRINHPGWYRYLGWLYHLAERLCVRGVDFIVPTDPGTRNYYLSRYPNAQVTASMPSPINLADFKLIPFRQARSSLNWPMSDPVVLFVGRLAKVKRIPLLLDAFGRVRQSLPDARLYLLGEGEDGEELRRLARQNCDGVTFLGAVPPQDIFRYYNGANLLVLCSLEEGSPTVVKEALACGAPIVSTDVGDVANVLNLGDDLGIIVPPDGNCLAQGILDVLSAPLDDEKRRQRRKAVGVYSVEKTGAKIIQICNQAIRNRKP